MFILPYKIACGEKSVVYASTGLPIAFATHHRAERTLDRATPKNTGVGGKRKSDEQDVYDCEQLDTERWHFAI
jgi:hypothetical protein